MKLLKWIGIILLCLLTAGPALATDEARQAYDKMVEESTQEADEYLEEKQEKMKETEKKKRIEKDEALQERIRDELSFTYANTRSQQGIEVVLPLLGKPLQSVDRTLESLLEGRNSVLRRGPHVAQHDQCPHRGPSRTALDKVDE